MLLRSWLKSELALATSNLNHGLIGLCGIDLSLPVLCCHDLSHPQNEIDTVLNLGVVPDRIIYANPCKVISHLRFAADKGVEMLTFDSESELYKIKKHFPGAK